MIAALLSAVTQAALRLWRWVALAAAGAAFLALMLRRARRGGAADEKAQAKEKALVETIRRLRSRADVGRDVAGPDADVWGELSEDWRRGD